MRKVLLSLIFSTSCICASAQFDFSLSVKTSGFGINGAYLELLDNKALKVIVKDTLWVDGNTLKFNGKLNQPSNFAKLIISTDNGNREANFILDQGKNSISIRPGHEKEHVDLAIDSANENTYTFNKIRSVVIKSLDQGAQTPRKLSHPEMLVEMLEIVSQQPNRYYSLIELYHLGSMSRDASYAKSLLAVLDSFDDTLKQTPLAAEFKREKMLLLQNEIRSQAGNKVQYFKIKNSDGGTFENASLKGKYYILAFSAVWCGPCQKQLPALQNIYKKYKSKGLEVVYFNDDDNLSRWKKHIKDHELTWINVSEGKKAGTGSIQQSFGIYALPNYLIIDPKGQIIYNTTSDNEYMLALQNEIEKIFALQDIKK